MSKLINHIIVQSLQEHDEANLNKYFNPYSFYQIVQIASHITKTPITNPQHKQKTYTKYRKAIQQTQIQEIQKLQLQLQTITDQDRAIITKYIEQETNKETEQEIKIPLYNKKSIGALSYVYDTE